MSRFSTNRRRLVSLLAGVSLIVSACSGSQVPDDPAAVAASEAAAANMDSLDQSGSVIDAEVLDVSDGSIATLRSAVAGDRPVLLWFWAPH